MKLQEGNKSVLIFSNQGLSPLHLGYELEIINRLIKDGINVISVTCNNELSTCFFNPTHNIIACSICEARTKKGHEHFPKIKSISLKNYNPEINSFHFTSLDKLIDLNYESINIGRGIASSLISLFREYDLNKVVDIDDLIYENQKMVINTILNFREFISEYSPEEVYLFNGRFAEIYGISQLCQGLNIDYKVYDTGSNRSKYLLKKNTSVHNIKNFQLDMKSIEKEMDKESIIKEGKLLFEKRMKGDQGEIYNFLSLQESGHLPSNFDERKNNIALFNSSEDEMKVIKDWQFSLYKNQNDAIKEILEHYKGDNTVHFYLRVHPNLLGIYNTQTSEINTLKYDNLTVIGPDKPIDTYALIRTSDKTICFGSTVGVEASYLDKPSILLGNSFYKGLGCVYEPESYEQLFGLISDSNLIPKKSFNIYLYIYTVLNAGIDCDKFEFTSIKNSTYDGVLMKRIYGLTLIKLIQYLNKVSLWRKMTKLVLKENLSIKNGLKLKSHRLDKTHHKS